MAALWWRGKVARAKAARRTQARGALDREVRLLRRRVRQLEAAAAERALIEEERRRLMHVLGERVKELTALHRAVGLLQDSASPPSTVLQKIVNLLPPAWQYPEITAARITFDTLTFDTPNFRQTAWSQTADLVTSDGRRGRIEVVYLEERPPFHEGPFLAEERDLINSLADSLASYLDRKHAEEALLHAHSRLRTLSQQLLEVQEQERRRLARDLHDEVGQALTAIKMNLQTMERIADVKPVAATLNDSKAILDQLMQRVRDLSLDLRPSLLDDVGLLAAVRWYVQRQAERAGLAHHVVAEDTLSSLPPHLATLCFRVIQEAVTNVLRHAKAASVSVTMGHGPGEVYLRVQDDGVGFKVDQALDRAARGDTMGLIGMQERVNFARGELTIESTPGGGTAVVARIPDDSEPG